MQQEATQSKVCNKTLLGFHLEAESVPSISESESKANKDQKALSKQRAGNRYYGFH